MHLATVWVTAKWPNTFINERFQFVTFGKKASISKHFHNSLWVTYYRQKGKNDIFLNLKSNLQHNVQKVMRSEHDRKPLIIRAYGCWQVTRNCSKEMPSTCPVSLVFHSLTKWKWSLFFHYDMMACHVFMLYQYRFFFFLPEKCALSSHNINFSELLKQQSPLLGITLFAKP